MKPQLRMTFDAGWGERYTMVIDLDERVANQFQRIDPPCLIPGVGSFKQAVEVMKRREFRKELFIREATRCGALLAERMEDAEGWHDASRIEHAKKELKQ